MKTIIFLIFLLTSTFSFAQCAGRFCVGMKAIDSYDNAGEITRIEGDKVYVRTQSGFEQESSPYTLSAETYSYGNIRQGMSVVDQYNQSGNVEAVFENGKVLYRNNGGSLQVSPYVIPEEPKNQFGEALKILENGKLISGSEICV